MADIFYLSHIRFGYGVLAELAAAMAGLGVTRPLLVTDAGVRAGRSARPGHRGLPRPAAVFDATPTNPTEAAVEAAVALYRAEGCDGVIAVGGGSPIDLAKGVALLATHPGPLATYAAILGGIPKITAATAPVIAIPTTAGTGSEVGRAALITLADGRKLGFISPHLIPKAAICDPELTLGLPRLADRRHRHGRADPLHRDLPLAALQPAGRGDRAGRPARAVALRSSAPSRTAPTGRPPGDDDGGAARAA